MNRSGIVVYKKSFRGDATGAAIAVFFILFILYLNNQVLLTIAIPGTIMIFSIIVGSVMKLWKLQLGDISFKIHYPLYAESIKYSDIKVLSLQQKGNVDHLLVHVKGMHMPINFSSLQVDSKTLHQEFSKRMGPRKSDEEAPL